MTLLNSIAPIRFVPIIWHHIGEWIRENVSCLVILPLLPYINGVLWLVGYKVHTMTIPVFFFKGRRNLAYREYR